MDDFSVLAFIFRNKTLKKALSLGALLYVVYLVVYLHPKSTQMDKDKKFKANNPSVTLRSLHQYLEVEPTNANKFQPWPQNLVYHNYDLHIYHRILQNETSVKIPHIIHQTWATPSVPNRFVPLVEKWLLNHKKWEYWFWTDEDGDRLARVMFPSLYPLYRKYVKNIQRVDVMKYMILYVFGGVFADIDLESLMPLDELTRLHHCIIAQEPELHSTLFWQRQRMPSNAFMAARPWHPIFKHLLQNLEKSHALNPEYEVENMTGQDYMSSLLIDYDGWMNGSHSIRDSVFLAPPVLFMPTFAVYALDSIKAACRKRTKYYKMIYGPCKALWRNRFLPRVRPGESYTNHLWAHSDYNKRLFLDKKDRTRIKDIRANWGHRANISSVLDFAEKNFEPLVW